MADDYPAGWIDWDRDKQVWREDIYVSDLRAFEDALTKDMWAPVGTRFTDLELGRRWQTEDLHIQGSMRKPGCLEEKFVWDVSGERGLAGTVVACDL